MTQRAFSLRASVSAPASVLALLLPLALPLVGGGCVPPSNDTCYGQLRRVTTYEYAYDPALGALADKPFSRTVNIYDGLSRINQRLIDTNNDGVIDTVVLFTFDDYGNVVQEQTDNDNDGTIDQVVTRVFDDNNQLLQEDFDSDGDGVFDSRTVNAYDARGSLVQEQTFAYGDAEIPETTLQHEYLCMGPAPSQVSSVGGR